jgi:hypothetical protein
MQCKFSGESTDQRHNREDFGRRLHRSQGDVHCGNGRAPAEAFGSKYGPNRKPIVALQAAQRADPAQAPMLDS